MKNIHTLNSCRDLPTDNATSSNVNIPTLALHYRQINHRMYLRSRRIREVYVDTVEKGLVGNNVKRKMAVGAMEKGQGHGVLLVSV